MIHFKPFLSQIYRKLPGNISYIKISAGLYQNLSKVENDFPSIFRLLNVLRHNTKQAKI